MKKYKEFISYYFEFVETGQLKIRVMFSQNVYRPDGLTQEQRDATYFILYYQFLKHAFGVKYCNPNGLDRVTFTVLPDQIPDTREKIDRFKDFVSMIPRRGDIRSLNVRIPRDQIADVDSRDHVILQGLDVVLGAMSAKLNGKFLEKPEGSRRRGKRTIAKEKLYKHINACIREIYPNFNIGISTGMPGGHQDRWHHPYRHWNFRPRNFIYEPRVDRK